ncbi:MAG TPA: aspartate racemase [Bacteroidetes bacterium]|nr:aspartate racemase [Bacteroidota bacterium]
MKTIGLVGGTSWASTIDYYRIINEEMNNRRGGLNFAKIVLYSLDFGEVHAFEMNKDVGGIRSLLVEAAKKLEGIGAQCILLCANTMHIHAERVQNSVGVPLLHIADATAVEINKKKMTKVGLLGTKLTMELDFYKKRLLSHGITAMVPPLEDRNFIHHAIDTELVKSLIVPATKARFLRIIDDLRDQGAEGVVLGCTEIPLLIKQDDTSLPVFDTTRIHSLAAVDFALG